MISAAPIVAAAFAYLFAAFHTFSRNSPRIIQKGLEYLDKVEDKEKREYILQRLERLQNGQEKIDRKIDSNERKRQSDERRRDK